MKRIAFILAFICSPISSLQAETLRLLTWGGYAPDDVVSEFEAQTGINVKVTLSNNEDMISRLRATGGAGFDLVQPSQDRILGAQKQFRLYKPIDPDRIHTEQFIPSMLAATREATTIDGQLYAVPHVWGTSGLVLHQSVRSQVKDYTDLCRPELAGRVSYRLKRPTLIGFAFAMGEDPFAAYAYPQRYQIILNKVEKKLIDCKANVKAYWTGGDQLLSLLRTGEILAAMAWDAGGWKLHKENPDINFVAPASGALGWIDTFALPRRGKNDAAAYRWINFVMQPDIAARITAASGNFTAAKHSEDHVDTALKSAYKASFDEAALARIRWYPPVPSGLEAMEGQVLDRIQAAQ